MGNWIGGPPPKTPKQMMRECEKDLIKGMRQLERTIEDLEWDDKRLIDEAKQAGRDNKIALAKQKAREVIRLRGATVRLNGMMAKMREVQINVRIMQSTHDMQVAMLSVTKAMVRINRKFNVPNVAQIIKTFERESYKLNTTQDMMDDAMDDTMSQYDDPDAENELVQQVMDEIGLNLSDQLGNTPKTRVGGAATTGAVGVNNNNNDDDDVLARLENLRQFDTRHDKK